MATKKREKQESGRPANWKEMCIQRVPPWMGKPPEPKEAEESSESVEK